MRLALLVAAALLPAACAGIEPPHNQFVGTWATAERQEIAFRDDTIVLTPPNEQPTAMNAETCDGNFRFAYGEKGRDMLLGLTPRQPDLKRRLTDLLVEPNYPVAEVNCGEGYSAYVMLDSRDMVVIHRDRDVAGVERLSRL